MTTTYGAAPAPAAPHGTDDRTPLRRRRDFRLLWAGQSVSAFGTEVTVLAIPFAAAVLLHATPGQMGLLTAAGTLPYLAIGLPAGVWVDRLRRRRPMLVAVDLASAAVLVTVPLAWALGVLSVWWLVGVELVVGSGRALFRPAYVAHLPDVVPDHQLAAASSAAKASEAGAALAGPGTGGLLVHALGAPVAVAVDAVSFVVSAMCLRRVRAPERPGQQPAARRPVRQELAAGIRTVYDDRWLRAIAGSAANLNIAGMAMLALFVLYATSRLGFGAGLIGLVTLAGGAGGLVGALMAPRLARRIGEGRAIVAASAAFSLLLFVIPAASGPKAVVVATLMGSEAVLGVAIMVFDATVGGLVPRITPRPLLGRVNASLGFVTQGAKPLGALAGGLTGELVGLRPALWLAAAFATTTVLWTWFSPLRHRPPGGPAQAGTCGGVPR